MRSQRGERAGRCRCPAREQLRACPPTVGMTSLAALMWRSAPLVALPSAWGAAMPAMAKDPAMREAPSAPGRMAPRPQGRGSAVSPWLTGLLMVASRGRPCRCWPCRHVGRGYRACDASGIHEQLHICVGPSPFMQRSLDDRDRHARGCLPPIVCPVGAQLACVRILSCGPLELCASY